MAEESKEAFLHRWSRRKHQAEKETPAVAEEKPAPPLPPVDKLTAESDFSGFMHPKVEDALRRAALKKLFNDPHFNIPDPFEPYSGDWTVGEAITPELLATLNQAKTHLFSEQEKEKPEGAAEAPAQLEGAEEASAHEEGAEEASAHEEGAEEASAHDAEVETSKPDEPRKQDA